MPKERRTRSASFDRHSRASPYPCSSSTSRRRPSPPARNPSELAMTDKEIGEWDEVRCPVCMEHPHNAVLLLCSSHKKGCRPFMCDTSYRHSNCLDQYRKATTGSPSSDGREEAREQCNLSCPLCRGLISGWTVDEPARRYMNSRPRSCSRESCSFSGVYGELRNHARKEHPNVRPSDVDPERQRDWQRMERQRDLRDLFSMLRQSASGDEDGIDVLGDGEGFSLTAHALPSFTVFFIVQVLEPGRSRVAARSAWRNTGSPSMGSSRSRRQRRMIMWGDMLNEPNSSEGRASMNHSAHGNTGDGNGSDSEETTANSENRRRQGRSRWMPRDNDQEDEGLL